MNLGNLSCIYFEKNLCRSCVLLDQSEQARNSEKLNSFSNLIRNNLGSNIKIEPIFVPNAVFPSRSKAKLSVSGSVERPILGLIDSRQKATELLDCPLHFQALNSIAHFLKSFITTANLIPYDIEKRVGELKGLILKSNANQTEIMVRFILRSKEGLFRIKKHLSQLLNEFESIKVVSVNIQPKPAAILEGPEEIILTESSFIWETHETCFLAYGPQSFSQVTPETARALYLFVSQLLASTKVKSLIDLFCGVGGFSNYAAPTLEWAHGIEISENAIDIAKMVRDKNEFKQLQFTSGDVEAFLKDYNGPKPDAVVVNPPRRGLSENILNSILTLAPRYVAYSSCNPETLVRDLRVLQSHYEIITLKPFDMFPLTPHLEAVAFLARVK